MLACKNKHERDKRVEFVEESHTYFVDGSCAGYISSTTLVHTLFQKFDADKIIDKMRKSRKWISSPYYGMTDDEIKNKWENNRDFAASEGTKMHENIENFYNGLQHEENTKEFKLFKQFLSDHESLIPYRTEWVIFDETSKVSGSVDMVYQDPDDCSKLVIADWKRSKEIKMENKWQRGTNEYTNHLDDCNFIHYSLQLSIYKHILETRYGVNVSQCFLIVLHPNQSKYMKYPIMDLSTEVKNILDNRTGHVVKPKSPPQDGKCSMNTSYMNFMKF